MQQDTQGPYDACPYCLTEICVNDQPETLEPETLEPETLEPEETGFEVEKTEDVEEKIEVPEAVSECSHHLGYLSEKSSKEQIPDECMTCKDIVTCMLKKMNT